MVMCLLSGTASLYILCITADMLAMERFNIQQWKNNDATIHNSLVSFITDDITNRCSSKLNLVVKPLAAVMPSYPTRHLYTKTMLSRAFKNCSIHIKIIHLK